MRPPRGLRGPRPVLLVAERLPNNSDACDGLSSSPRAGPRWRRSYFPRPGPVAIIEESQPLEVAKRLVQRGKRVTIKDRAFIISLVRRTYGRMFDYEVEVDAACGENGHAGAPSSPNVDMGNPSSSYRR